MHVSSCAYDIQNIAIIYESDMFRLHREKIPRNKIWNLAHTHKILLHHLPNIIHHNISHWITQKTSSWHNSALTLVCCSTHLLLLIHMATLSLSYTHSLFHPYLFSLYTISALLCRFNWSSISTSHFFHYSEMDNTYAHKMWVASTAAVVSISKEEKNRK